MSAVGSDPASSPATEAAMLQLVPVCLASDAIGKHDCMSLLDTCIYRGWIEPIGRLASAESCCHNEEQQRQMFENALCSQDCPEDKSIAIFNLLAHAWPDVLQSNLEYLAVKAHEGGPLPIWKQLLHRLVLQDGNTPSELASLLSFLKIGGRTQEHNDAAVQAWNEAQAAKQQQA